MSLVSSNGWKGALAGCLALAAGVAAALQVRAGCAARDVAVRDLQKALAAKGVRLDPELVKPHRNYRSEAAVRPRTEGF